MSVTSAEAQLLLSEFVAQNPINWSEFVADAQAGRTIKLPTTLFGVEFLSVMPLDTPARDLGELDRLDTLAIAEAYRSYEDRRPSGLYLYKPGQRNELGIARSVCVWESHQAVLDKLGPDHIKAAKFGASLYAFYKPNKRNLILDKDGALAEVTEFED